ncbi:hypothetical protein FRC04_002067 [Tulasnella sp. 424]|nr:hypothetical protein FRC04_002067 [Tulasnella sp. 424]KAG8975538.1 hypothetical protein FRC05_005607 [Tulasnella sp. 425]
MSQGPTDALRAQSASGFGAAVINTPSSLPSPLEIPELVENIVSYLVRKDIVSAARVCRAWSEPALDQIWRNLPSIIPLFSLISPMVCRTGYEWDFEDDIQDADCSRYAFYFHRIRNVTLRHVYILENILPTAIQAFTAWIPSYLIPPPVSSITATLLFHVPATLLAVPFISESLRKLSLTQKCGRDSLCETHCNQSMLDVVSAVAALPNACLEDLTLIGHVTDANLCSAITACLNKHGSTIYKIKTTLPLDHQAWSSVCGLPSLREIDFVPPRSADAGELLPETIAAIQELEKSSPILESLSIRLLSPSGPGEDPEIFRSLIRQLSEFHNLKSLSISVDAPLSLSEDDVLEMGTSWPGMRVLRLNPEVDWIQGQQMAQSALSLLPNFLRHFPCIEELHVPFCGDSPLPPVERPVPTSRLRVFEVSSSRAPWQDRELVADYLASVLPLTAHIENNYDVPYWKAVLERFNCIRKQEAKIERAST